MKIAMLVSRIRVEEKLLIEELERQGIEHEVIDVRTQVFDIHDASPWHRFDAVLERCIVTDGARAEGVHLDRDFA